MKGKSASAILRSVKAELTFSIIEGTLIPYALDAFQDMTTPPRIIACCCCIAASMLANAECKNAQVEDVPHGANVIVELRQQKVHRLFGTVQFPDGKPADDIVVEVYRRLASQDGDDAREQTRLAACVTGNGGGFSFNDIKPGRYLLIVGARKADGMNELYVPIILKKSWWRRKGSRLRLTLVIGT